jgi:hypothetical protein
MKNFTVAVLADTYCRARIWAAKHMTSLSRIVAKTARQIAEQTPAGTPPKNLESGCETVDPSHINNLRPQLHSFTVPQFLEAHPPPSGKTPPVSRTGATHWAITLGS